MKILRAVLMPTVREHGRFQTCSCRMCRQEKRLPDAHEVDLNTLLLPSYSCACSGRTSMPASNKPAAASTRRRTGWCRSPSPTTTASPCSTCPGARRSCLWPAPARSLFSTHCKSEGGANCVCCSLCAMPPLSLWRVRLNVCLVVENDCQVAVLLLC